MADLTGKQQRFVEEYLVDLNATQAAKRAGYSEKTAEQVGYQLLHKTLVQRAIQEARAKQQERTQITADAVLKEYAKIAFFDPRKLFHDNGQPKDIAVLDDDTAGALAGLDVTEEYEGNGQDREFVGYTKKYKIADKLRALEALAKHLGLFERSNEDDSNEGCGVVQMPSVMPADKPPEVDA